MKRIIGWIFISILVLVCGCSLFLGSGTALGQGITTTPTATASSTNSGQVSGDQVSKGKDEGFPWAPFATIGAAVIAVCGVVYTAWSASRSKQRDNALTQQLEGMKIASQERLKEMELATQQLLQEQEHAWQESVRNSEAQLSKMQEEKVQERQRKEKADKAARTYADHPPSTEKILGRKEELGKVLELLETQGCLAITGIGGQGKSILAEMVYREWQRRVGKRKAVWVRCVVESGSRRISVSDIVLMVAYKVGGEAELEKLEGLEQDKPEGQLYSLLQILRGGNYLLVLDNFESLLTQDGSKLVEEGGLIEELLEAACEGLEESRVVITSQVYPRVTERGVGWYQLPGLTKEVGSEFLRRALEKSQVKPLPGNAELERAVGKNYTDGNPQLLLWLTGVVAAAERPLEYILDRPELWREDKAEQLLNEIWEKRLIEEEREVLKTMAVLRSPFSLRELKGLANKLGQSMVTEKCERLAMDLKRKSLLERSDQEESAIAEQEERLYGLHPRVQGYVHNAKLDAGQRKARHNAAASYYLSLPVPDREEGIKYTFGRVEPFLKGFFQLLAAEEYDQAADLLFDKKLQEDLDRWGQSELLVEMCHGLLPREDEQDRLLKEERRHGEIMGILGKEYHNLGLYDKAIEYIQNSLDIAGKIENRQEEGRELGNLTRAYEKLGKYDNAIKNHTKALEIARDIKDRQGERLELYSLGQVYDRFERYDEAIECHMNSLEIARKDSDREGEADALGNLGKAYYGKKDYSTAKRYHEQRLEIAQRREDKREEGHALSNLGLVYNSLGNYDEAIKRLNDALEIARKINDRRGKSSSLSILGIVLMKSLNNRDEAIEKEKEALQIAQNIKYRRGEGQDYSNLGLIYANFREYKEAILNYWAAKQVFLEIHLESKVKAVEVELEKIKAEVGETQFEQWVSEQSKKNEEKAVSGAGA